MCFFSNPCFGAGSRRISEKPDRQAPDAAEERKNRKGFAGQPDPGEKSRGARLGDRNPAGFAVGERASSLLGRRFDGLHSAEKAETADGKNASDFDGCPDAAGGRRKKAGAFYFLS